MVTFPAALVDQMVEHARRELPNEACGLIAGADGTPVKVFTMRNADESPVTYRLDAKEQLAVFDEMEREGWDLFAIFHSHTHTPAFPSPTDLRQAFYPEAYYVLVSLEDGERPDVRAFRIVEGRITEHDLEIA